MLVLDKRDSMVCPKCESRCSKKDFTNTEVIYARPFGREAKERICYCCLAELKRKVPVYTMG